MVATQSVAQATMEEWGAFFTLLRIYLLFGIPSLGLQTVFAQQTAAAVTMDQRAILAATARAMWRGVLMFWLGLAAVALVGQRYWLELLGINNPAALWATLALGLASLWAPVFKGIVQGQQRFPALGWSLILDGCGRFVSVTLIVGWLGGQAAGAMTGALFGQVMALAVVWWAARDVWRMAGSGFAWGPWVRRVAPLAVGTGVIGFISTIDVVYVRVLLPSEQSDVYNRGAMIGLALMTVAMPLVQVMFPKVARSAALTRPSQAMSLALAATAGVGVLAAFACTLFPELPLRIVFIGNPEAWKAAPLVPWFAWVLLPLILAMVLINNLLAQERFRIVPWMLVVTVGYLGALAWWKPRLAGMEMFEAFRTVLSTLGVCNAALLTLAVVFTFREHVPVPAAAEAPSV
jgi:O-antigen/teichoic acid export membrane protein